MELWPISPKSMMPTGDVLSLGSTRTLPPGWGFVTTQLEIKTSVAVLGGSPAGLCHAVAC